MTCVWKWIRLISLKVQLGASMNQIISLFFFPQPLRQLHQIVLSLALVGSPKPSLHELLFLVADSFHYGVTEEC